jgi:MraZ protein
MSGQLESPATVEAPFGFLAARVDEQGRLKLPAALAQYFAALKEPRVFVTTFDEITGRIYTIRRWREILDLLSSAGEGAADRAKLRFIAKHYGADTEIQAQGRVLLPTSLRKKLELENAAAHLDCVRGHVEMYSEATYNKYLTQAQMSGPANSKLLAELGL